MWIFALVLAAAPADSATKIAIDGHTYRVSVKAGQVLVANKAFVVRADMAERDRQRAAVIKVTGCEPFDELPSDDGRFRAKLRCR